MVYMISALACVLVTLPGSSQAGYVSSGRPSLMKRDDTATNITSNTSTGSRLLNLTAPPNPPTNATKGSANPSCTDLSTGLATRCFEELQLASYIINWTATHQCYPSEGFATCFFRHNIGDHNRCGTVAINACFAPQLANPDPKAFYTAYNIYVLNQYFVSWYIAIGSGYTILDNLVQELESLLKPVVSTKLIPLTKEKYQIQSKQAQSKLNATATSVLSNATEFIAYTKSGRFSVLSASFDPWPYAKEALTADIVVKSLNSSGIYLTMGRDTNPFDLTTNGTKLAYPIYCGLSANASGVCDAWWYSKQYTSSFGLVSGSQPQKNLGSLTRSLLNITSGERLFAAAYACSAENLDRPTDEISFNITSDGLIDFTCVSKLPIYTWDMFCHSTSDNKDPTPANSKCEFIEGPSKPGFWDVSGGAHTVPAAYLGPALTQGRLTITRQ